MLNPASRRRERCGMPRTDPVPTAPAPPIWNTLLAPMPATRAPCSARRRCAGSSGRRRPARPQKGGSHLDSHRSPWRSTTVHRSSTTCAPAPPHEPVREGEGEVEADGQAAWTARRRATSATRSSTVSVRSRPWRSSMSSPSRTWAARCGSPPRAPPRTSRRPRRPWARPPLQTPTRATSLVTVFQFLVVLETPRWRSRYVPVSLVAA